MILNKTSFVSLDEVTFITKLAGFEYTKYLSNNFVDFGIPVIQGRNIKNGILNFENIKFIKEELSNSLKRSQVKKNMLLFSYVGTVGDVYLHSSDKILHLGSNVAKIVPNESLINPYFLFYSLKSPLFLKSLFSKTKGSVQSNINMKDMRSIKIWLPELKKQKSIVDYLYDIDKKIEVNNKIIKNLEELAQNLYKRWLVDFEFPNEKGKPYKSSGGEMIDSELGLIPKGWKVIKIDEILIFERGIEPGSKYYSSVFKENLIPFYRVGDLETRNNVYIDKSLTKDKFVDEKDVLVSFDGAIGRTGIGFVGSYSTGLRKVYDKSKKFKNSLIYFIMKSDSIQNTMKEHANGTTILHASTSIPYLKIAYKYEELKEFELKIDPIFHELIILKKQNKYLENLRDLLLPKLMSGEIEVLDME
jgi:type I restriction enzyme, S subunit